MLPMLIRASGLISSGFYVCTLGNTCFYLAGNASAAEPSTGSVFLFDPGSSAHWPFLEQRLAQLGLSSAAVTHVLLTHLHADRMGALPYIRKEFPSIKVCGAPAMQHCLHDRAQTHELFQEDCMWREKLYSPELPEILSFEEYAKLLVIDKCVVDSDVLHAHESLSVRALNNLGHTSHSLAYLVQPGNHLVVDEGFGYYQGRNLAAPGGDEDLSRNIQSIERLVRLDLSSICFPNMGVLVGNLVRKHLQAIVQNIQDLRNEAKKAHELKMPMEQIEQAISAAFYTTPSCDPVVQHNLNRSCSQILKQLKAETDHSTPACALTN